MFKQSQYVPLTALVYVKEEVDQSPTYFAEAPRLIVTYYAAGPSTVCLGIGRSDHARRGVVPQDVFLYS